MQRKNYENKIANEWTWNKYSCKRQFIVSNCTAWVCNLKILANSANTKCRRVTRGGDVKEVSPALFQKLEKSALVLGKNALIVVIYATFPTVWYSN